MADFTEYPAELQTYDAWLAAHRRKPGQPEATCESCGNGEAITAGGQCILCAHYEFGYDQAQHVVASEILEGAVRGALRVHLSASRIAAMVQAAIEAQHTEETDRLHRRSVKVT